MVFYIFDRWGKQLGTVQDIISATHADEVNGEDALTIEFSGSQLLKGQRVVWRDKFMRWHEHTVSEVTETNADGKVISSAYCENSLAELLTDYIVEREPQGEASSVLRAALEPTRWESGTVDVLGTHRTSWYHISAYEAVKNILEVWGGELSTTIEVDGDAVVHRRVDILTRRGSDRGQLFTYGRNLAKVEQRVSSDDVCTALYGYGKGLEQYDEDGDSTGGYSRKLTFGDINGGRDWVGDEDARLIWGLPDGHGGVKHTFGQVEFSDCEDAAELLALTKEALKTRSKPTVTYTGDVVSLAAGGFANGQDSQAGDTVYIRDTSLGLRLEGRVLRVEYDLLKGENTKMTLGNLTRNLSDEYKSQQADIDFLKSRAAAWDDAAGLSDPFLNAVINSWNEVINADGGYVYWKQGDGITVYDKHPDANPTKAIQLKGGSFRIANSKTPDGEWDWRTFGTGDGFVADLLVAGTIQGGSNYWNLSTGDLLFTQGGIRDAEGNNYWDLDTGEFRLSPGATIDGKTVGEMADDAASSAVDAQTQDDIFDKLTNGGQRQGIYLTDGTLYINADYLKTGKITDGKGYNFWDLNTGEFSLSSTAKVGGKTVEGIAEEAADAAVDAQTQREIFDKLTGGGTRQGIYLSDGTLYVNAQYIQTGMLTDKSGSNYWNLDTGDFKLSPSSKVGSQSLQSYVDGRASAKNTDSFSTARAADVFNKLTNNDMIQGITMSGSSLYVNASYINTGTLTVGDVLTANVGSGKVTIAGFTAEGNRLVGENIAIEKKRVTVFSENQPGIEIGELGAGFVNETGTAWRFLRLNAKSNPNNHVAGISFDASDNIRMCYVSYYPGGEYTANRWHMFADLDMHTYKIHGGAVASAADIAIGGSVDDEMTFLAPVKINDDGTIAEYAPVKVGFTNGILTSMTKPEEG